MLNHNNHRTTTLIHTWIQLLQEKRLNHYFCTGKQQNVPNVFISRILCDLSTHPAVHHNIREHKFTVYKTYLTSTLVIFHVVSLNQACVNTTEISTAHNDVMYLLHQCCPSFLPLNSWRRPFSTASKTRATCTMQHISTIHGIKIL